MANLAENILASSIVLLAFLVILGLVYSFFVWRASSKKAGTTSEFLKNLHCDDIQGYYFSKPLPVNEFEDFVRKHTGL